MKSTYPVVRIGYNRFCFKTLQEAMAFYQMVCQSVPVSSNYGDLPDGRSGISYVRDEDVELGMEQVDASSMELNKTLSQMRQAAANRADIDGSVKIVADPFEIENDTPLAIEHDESFI